MTKVAILGSGPVGTTLSDGFLAHGHTVMRGSREPAKLDAWKQAAKGEASTGTFQAAAAWGEVVVTALKGTAAEAVVKSCAAELAGKLVMDTTNPIAEAPPQNGVLLYFTQQNDSLMEHLQKAAPQAHFVKAWSCVGGAMMVNPKLPATPTMFICGNDAGAKARAAEILKQFGYDALDMGGVEGARPIEALCQLWCIPGFMRNDWMHAFKMLWPA
ncbi:MAG TPA: NAD(P)-binding domain-containing protein [Kofleriaceae bacterium]|nr:NAD(P)-binding domain-containing protein [Kofleriaceae bacterium]